MVLSWCRNKNWPPKIWVILPKVKLFLESGCAVNIYVFQTSVRYVTNNYTVKLVKEKTNVKQIMLQIKEDIKLIVFKFIIINNHINFCLADSDSLYTLYK